LNLKLIVPFFFALPSAALAAGQASGNGAVYIALRCVAIAVFAFFAYSHRSQTLWILLALLAGAELGHDFPAMGVRLQFLGTIFLRLVKTIMAPLLFSTLVVGMAGHRDLKRVGRLGFKSLLYFEIVSTLALLIGFAAITFSRAGATAHLAAGISGESVQFTPHALSQLVVEIFPENVAKSVAEGQVLQVVIFTIIFALALTLVPDAKRLPILVLAESLSSTMFKFTNLVMLFAPFAVFGSVAFTMATAGPGVFVPLLKVLATMYGGLVAFILLVLLPIAVLFRIPIKKFLRATAEPVALGFATASSEAALPRAIERMETFGVPRDTAAFVLPTGFAFNADGSSLYQSIALIFMVQAAGLHLSLSQQVTMLVSLAITSKGTAGVARSSLVIVLATATAFHLPTEAGFLLIGIDQVMDMGRTAINVFGNCLACVAIATSEGEFPSPLN
jgi:proton glutamate symport protein